MSIQSLQDFARHDHSVQVATPAIARTPLASDHTMAMALLRDGVISAHQMVQALAQVKAGGGRLMPALMAGHPHPDQVCRAVAELSGLGVADPAARSA